MVEGVTSKFDSGNDSGGALRSCDGKIGRIYLDSRPPKPRKEGFVRLVAFALALIMVAGAGLGVFSAVKKDADKENVRLAAPMFMAHSPIHIESEAALTVANGVNGGDGSVGNPFVIQGWDIDASAAPPQGAGINITNISSHLVIRNVNVHSGYATNPGIILMNVTNCTVEYSQSTDSAAGIAADMCDHIVIQHNTVEDNVDEGIAVFDTSHALVANNIAVNSPGIGVMLLNSTGSWVVNNTMSHNNISAGLALMFCSMTTVSGNIMDNNSIGLELMMADGSFIHNNNIVRNMDSGVNMLDCQNNTLFSNMIADTSGSGPMAGYGAFLMFSTNNTFYHNDFLDNFMTPQASDDSDLNHWNLSNPIGGNYWGDYSGSDADHDGFGDTAYDIYSYMSVLATHDSCPVMTELTYGDTPTAYFTVTPASGPASTEFMFNASLCWDPDNLTSDLQVRWDFDGDGAWDTGWSNDKTIQHSYPQAGEYNVTMEVTDGAGHTSNMTWHIEVEQLVIPEFPTLMVPICSVIAIFLVVGAFGRRR